MTARRAVVLWCVLAASSFAEEHVAMVPRRSKAADLMPRFERYVTANGLVVLLSPDPKANSIVVDLSFAAGAVHQPPRKAGLAHLVEHVFSSGSTPDTDYLGMLERVGGIGFNAFTTLDRMNFRVEIPPEALPLALWVNADRLGAMAPTITDGDLTRHKRLVKQERLHQIDDVPYGGNSVALMRSLFPREHPLHTVVIGGRDDIEAHTLEDVMRFQATLLVPANGVLTLTGNFDPAVAREWIEKTLATLPAGVAAPPPPSTPTTRSRQESVTEGLGRRSKVTLAWTLADPAAEVADTLEFGSLLLALYADGLVGISVNSSLAKYAGGALFVLEVTLPHAVDNASAAAIAEAIFAFLSQDPLPKDLVGATQLAWDRGQMARLQSTGARATFLTRLEVAKREQVRGLTLGERHWGITPAKLQAVAGSALRGDRVTIISRPERPLPAKVPR